MDLKEVKNFLKVDFDEDDAYINLLVDAAKGYIVDAVGNFDKENSRHNLLMLSIVSEMYQNRQYTKESQKSGNTESSNDKAAYVIKSIIRQLQLEEV